MRQAQYRAYLSRDALDLEHLLISFTTTGRRPVMTDLIVQGNNSFMFLGDDRENWVRMDDGRFLDFQILDVR